jgi:hypothetical protein
MKRIKQVFAIAGSILVFAACQNPDQNQEAIARDNTTGSQRYVDPNTGAPVDLYYNKEEKMTYNRETDKPVDLYINTNTGDTVYGKGRYVVNGYIVRGEDGVFRLDNSRVEMDGDELKIIGQNGSKLKVDDDEMKYKDGDEYKVKRDGDETKIKTDDKKIKKEEGKPTKVKDDK